jgi:hypothetical protein
MFYKIILYFQRRRKHSYTDLWEMVYGDGEFSKGLIREYEFTQEIAHMWKVEYDRCKEGRYNKEDGAH